MYKLGLTLLTVLASLIVNAQIEFGLHRSLYDYGGEEGSGYNGVGIVIGKPFKIKQMAESQLRLEPKAYVGYYYESKRKGSGYSKYTYAEEKLNAGISLGVIYAYFRPKGMYQMGLTAGYHEVPGIIGPHLGYHRKLNQNWSIGANLLGSVFFGSYSEAFTSINLIAGYNLFKP
jgi:hypothetical protein